MKLSCTIDLGYFCNFSSVKMNTVGRKLYYEMGHTGRGNSTPSTLVPLSKEGYWLRPFDYKEINPLSGSVEGLTFQLIRCRSQIDGL